MHTSSFSSWLTASAAARRLSVSSERVRQLVRAGRLTFVSTPLGRLIDPASVDAYAAARGRKAAL